MKRFYSFSLAILCIALLVSCQKSDPKVNPPVAKKDSTTLHKIIDLDTTKAQGLDTVNQVTFFYDNAKRLKSALQFIYDINSRTETERHLFEFTYNSNDSLPLKREFTYTSANGSATSVRHYIYSANGSLLQIVDSTLSPLSPATNYFTIERFASNASQLRSYSGTRVPYVLDSSRYQRVAYSKTNGNINYQVDSSYRNTNYEGIIVKYTMTYDDHPNPFRKFNDRPNLARVVQIGSFLTDGSFTQSNNILSYKKEMLQFGFPVYSDHYTYIYEYNANGLPSICRMKYPSLNLKRKYFYIE